MNDRLKRIAKNAGNAIMMVSKGRRAAALRQVLSEWACNGQLTEEDSTMIDDNWNAFEREALRAARR